MAKNPHSREEVLENHIEMTRRWILRGIKRAADLQAQFKAQGIDVSTRTVYRYVSEVKSRGAKEVKEREGLNKTMDELAIDLKNIVEEVSRELWKQYHAPITFRAKCPHPTHRKNNACGYEAEIKMQFGMVKVQALKEIRVAAKEWVEMMQDLGLVYKAPEKTQFLGADGKPVDPSFNVNIDKAAISQEFTAFIKAKHQNPVGQNNPHDAIDRSTIPAELKPN